MIRSVLFAAVAAALPATHCADLVVGTAAHPDRHSQKYIEVLADAAKARFAAFADAGSCRQEDNRYAFDVLRDSLPGAGQAMLDDAAAQGLTEGGSRSVTEGRSSAAADTDGPSPDSCRANVEKLRAADNRLLILSDHLPSD